MIKSCNIKRHAITKILKSFKITYFDNKYIMFCYILKKSSNKIYDLYEVYFDGLRYEDTEFIL